MGGGSVTIQFDPAKPAPEVGYYAAGQTRVWVRPLAGSSITISGITTTVPPQTARTDSAFVNSFQNDPGDSYGIQVDPSVADPQAFSCEDSLIPAGGTMITNPGNTGGFSGAIWPALFYSGQLMPDNFGPPTSRPGCSTGTLTQQIPSGGLPLNVGQILLIAKLFANRTTFVTNTRWSHARWVDLLLRIVVVAQRPPCDGGCALAPAPMRSVPGGPSRRTWDLRDMNWSKLPRNLPNWRSADPEFLELARSDRWYWQNHSLSQGLNPLPTYGANLARSVSTVMRSMIASNTPTDRALQYAILLLQGAADIYHNSVHAGVVFLETGGHAHGKLPQLSFLGWLSDDPGVKAHLQSVGFGRVRNTFLYPPNGGYGECTFFRLNSSGGPFNPPVFFNDDENQNSLGPDRDRIARVDYATTILSAAAGYVHLANLMGYTSEVFDPNVRAVMNRFVNSGAYQLGSGTQPNGSYHLWGAGGTFYDSQSLDGPLWNEYFNSVPSP